MIDDKQLGAAIILHAIWSALHKLQTQNLVSKSKTIPNILNIASTALREWKNKSLEALLIEAKEMYEGNNFDIYNEEIIEKIENFITNSPVELRWKWQNGENKVEVTRL